MAHLQRLTLLLLVALALGFYSPNASAQVTGCLVNDGCSSSEAYALALQAAQNCAAAAGAGWSAQVQGPNPLDESREFWQARAVNGGSFSACSFLPQRNFYYVKGPTADQCDARNSDPAQAPGPGLYLDSQVGDRCVGGCTLTIVGDPIEVVQGRVQGQSANFYRFNREYAGPCSGEDPPDSSELIPTDDGPECNADLGVCVTPDGKTEYCTFNPDGSPSSCVPAEDYDNDGILDEDDADPGDAQDSTDQGEGDEKDNVASGGASCSTAPSCTGDGIACATLYQQWKTRCAVEALQIEVDVNVPPGEYQEIQAGDLGNANDFGDAGVTASDAWRPNGTGNGNGTNPTFDDSGWLASRSCPVIPVVSTSIMGNAISIDFNNPQLCWFLSIGAQLVLVFAALASIRIYWKVI